MNDLMFFLFEVNGRKQQSRRSCRRSKIRSRMGMHHFWRIIMAEGSLKFAGRQAGGGIKNNEMNDMDDW